MIIRAWVWLVHTSKLRKPAFCKYKIVQMQKWSSQDRVLIKVAYQNYSPSYSPLPTLPRPSGQSNLIQHVNYYIIWTAKHSSTKANRLRILPSPSNIIFKHLSYMYKETRIQTWGKGCFRWGKVPPHLIHLFYIIILHITRSFPQLNTFASFTSLGFSLNDQFLWFPAEIGHFKKVAAHQALPISKRNIIQKTLRSFFLYCDHIIITSVWCWGLRRRQLQKGLTKVVEGSTPIKNFLGMVCFQNRWWAIVLVILDNL